MCFFFPKENWVVLNLSTFATWSLVLISWKVSTSGPYFLEGLVSGPYMGGPYKIIMRVSTFAPFLLEACFWCFMLFPHCPQETRRKIFFADWDISNMTELTNLGTRLFWKTLLSSPDRLPAEVSSFFSSPNIEVNIKTDY